MNRIKIKLKENKKLLSIYFSAGFPKIDDTVEIIKELEKNNVDFIEIGLPFSDPLADGPTIQDSSSKALKNGMNTNCLFNQLANIRNTVKIPLIIMGYFNPILQYGVKEFCKKCEEVGIDGCIIPDLPVQIFNKNYKKIFDKYGLINIFLIVFKLKKNFRNFRKNYLIIEGASWAGFTLILIILIKIYQIGTRQM